MHILIIHGSPWNDKSAGNNVLTNWFHGMDAELANVYRGDGMPYNSCCEQYFQITDKMMLKSLISRKRAGRAFRLKSGEDAEKNTVSGSVMRRKPPAVGEFARFLRSLIWQLGRYDKRELKKFIDDFKPDVIFSCRKAGPATLRLERVIHSMTDAPFVAFTGDDEYSLRQFRFSLFFWINKFRIRRGLRKNTAFYKKYLALSDEQADEYSRVFQCSTGVIKKCAVNTYKKPEYNTSEKAVSLIYAGRLYCNRWKTLAILSDSIRKINCEAGKELLTLDIFAAGSSSDKQRRRIEADGKYVKIHSPVPAEQLRDIYKSADIALHVESFDIKNRLDTRVSFSTKIVDCLSSGCAVMAICWEEHSGYIYLKKEDAAICISSQNEIENQLRTISESRSIIEEYAEKAYACCKKNHDKQTVQSNLYSIFEKAIGKEHEPVI